MNRKAISTEFTASSVVRCAIYTRKSTEEGLEQEFNSLDAQRESAEAYDDGNEICESSRLQIEEHHSDCNRL